MNLTGLSIKKALKYFVIIAGSLLLLMILTLWILSFSLQARVHEKLISIVKSELGADISFKDVSLSLLKNFPRMRLDIDGLSVFAEDMEAIRIGRATIIFNLEKILSDSLDMEQVVITDGELTLLTDEQGKQTRIPSPQKANPGKSRITLILDSQELIVKNILFISESRIKKNLTRVHISEGRLDVEINKPVTIVRGNIKGSLDSLVAAGNVIFSKLEARADGLLFEMNSETGILTLQQGALTANELKLVPSLVLTRMVNGTFIDLSISSENDLNAFLLFFNLKTGTDFKQTNPDARATLDFRQKGLINAFQKPYTELDFAVRDARLESSMLPFPLTNLFITGNYNNGDMHSPETAGIFIDTIHAQVSDSYIDGKIRVNDLRSPQISARLVSAIELSQIVKPTRMITASGKISAKINIEGKIADFKKSGITVSNLASGEVRFEKVNVFLQDSIFKIQIDNGMLRLKGNSVDIESFRGKLDDQAFHFSGRLADLDQLIYKKNIKGVINAGFDLIDLSGIKAENLADTASHEVLDFLHAHSFLKVTANIGKLKGEFGEFDQISLQAESIRDSFLIRNLTLGYKGLNIKCNGLLSFNGNRLESVWAQADLSARKLNLQDLLGSAGKDISTTLNDKPRFPPGLDISANILLDTLMSGEMAFCNISAKVSLTPEIINLSSLKAQLPLGKTEMNLSLAHWADTSSILSGHIGLSFDSLDVKSFLLTFSDIDKSLDPSRQRVDEFIHFGPMKTNLSFSLFTNKINYAHILADSVIIIGNISEGRTEIKRSVFNYAGGKVNVEGILLKNDDSTYTGNVISSASGVDTKVLLYSLGNFGQSFLTAESVAGNISWTSDLYFKFDNLLKPIDKDDFWKFEFKVSDARLSNVIPVEKALSFARQKAKEDILVSNLNFNTYYVREKLYFQNVFIKNSVSNMEIFGTYTPDDTLVDLNIRLNLSDLLFKTMKQRTIETADGSVDLGNGRDLNLKFTGTVGEHKVKLNTRKEYDRQKGIMLDQFLKFDDEMNQRISVLSSNQ